MKRREFIALIAGAAAVAPLAASGQSAVRRIGLLMFAFSNAEVARVLYDPLLLGLRELGWIDGQNITIEMRFANGNVAVLPGLAAELVRLGCEIIVAESTPAVAAAKDAI